MARKKKITEQPVTMTDSLPELDSLDAPETTETPAAPPTETSTPSAGANDGYIPAYTQEELDADGAMAWERDTAGNHIDYSYNPIPTDDTLDKPDPAPASGIATATPRAVGEAKNILPPSQSTQGAQDYEQAYYDGKENDIKRTLERANKVKVLTPEEQAKEDKRRKWRELVAAIGDATAHFANLGATANYAPAMDLGNSNISGKATQRYERLLEADKKAREYRDALLESGEQARQRLNKALADRQLRQQAEALAAQQRAEDMAYKYAVLDEDREYHQAMAAARATSADASMYRAQNPTTGRGGGGRGRGGSGGKYPVYGPNGTYYVRTDAEARALNQHYAKGGNPQAGMRPTGKKNAYGQEVNEYDPYLAAFEEQQKNLQQQGQSGGNRGGNRGGGGSRKGGSKKGGNGGDSKNGGKVSRGDRI